MTLLSNCAPTFASQTLGKLSKEATARITRVKSGESCNILGFRKGQPVDGKASFSTAQKDKPDEKLCGMDKCDMTSVVTVTDVKVKENGEDGLPVAGQTQFVTPMSVSGEKFTYGYTRFMAKGKAGDKIEIYLRNSKEDKNQSKYNYTLKEDGWNVVVIENFNPDTVIGSGWVGTTDGYEMVIVPKQESDISLSTIELFENAYEFERTQSFILTCLNEFTPETELTTTEDVCDMPQYDETATTMEITLNGAQFVGDMFGFGGLTKRSDKAEYPVAKNDKFVATKEVVDGVEYSMITLPDLADIKCPAFLVQPQDCELGTLKYLEGTGNIGSMEVPDDAFIRDGNKLYFNSTYADAEVIVGYPTMISGQAYTIGVNELNRNRYRLEIELPYGKGSAILVLDNVMITSIPWTWTKEEGAFELPMTATRDVRGNYGKWIIPDNEK